MDVFCGILIWILIIIGIVVEFKISNDILKNNILKFIFIFISILTIILGVASN